MMVPTPRFTPVVLPTNKPTSQLLLDIEEFRDFAYSVEAAAKNRAKAEMLIDPVNPTYLISRMEIDARPRAPRELTTYVASDAKPAPTQAEMVAMIDELKADPVKRLAYQRLAWAMGFDPIGDHVRQQRPRGRFVTLDDAGDPDGGWWGKGDRS